MITVATISRHVLPTIAEIEADLFETAFTLSALKSLFDGPAFVGLVSFDDEKICGYLLAHRTQDHIEILSLGTLRTHQRRGHADQLLATLIATACDAILFLEVAVKNKAAIDFYGKNGFVEVGRRIGYYRRGRDVCDALVMRRG